jgi:hypothetical protein
LERANLGSAQLREANLSFAHLNDAVLLRADLRRAELREAHLEGARLGDANVEGANLYAAHLEGAIVHRANLRGANLSNATLAGAGIWSSHLEGANFSLAILDEKTNIAACTADRKTDFRNANLDGTRVEESLRQLLRDNVRRLSWLDWYRRGPWPLRIPKKALIHPIWWVSDYGRSTLRIILVFFVLALLFAATYYFCGLTGHPLLANLFEEPNGNSISAGIVFARACYFSVVAMTTVGFGDVHVNPQSLWGHMLVGVQVLLGYVILGAVVTRLGVLFTGSGPSAKATRRPSKSAPNDTEESSR